MAKDALLDAFFSFSALVILSCFQNCNCVTGHPWDLCGMGAGISQASTINVNFSFAEFDITNSGMPRWDSPTGCKNLTLEWGGKWGYSRYYLKNQGDALRHYGYCTLDNTLPLDCPSWYLYNGTGLVEDSVYKIRNCSYFTDRSTTCMNTTYLSEIGYSSPSSSYCLLNPSYVTALNGTYTYAGCDFGIPYYSHTINPTTYIAHWDWCIGWWGISSDITSQAAYAFCLNYDLTNCDTTNGGGLYQYTGTWNYDTGVTIISGCVPTQSPTLRPTNIPTGTTQLPSHMPSTIPTIPSFAPSFMPTDPSYVPTGIPTNAPTNIPSDTPTDIPTNAPTNSPTPSPTDPTKSPTFSPTPYPTVMPSIAPTTPSDDGLTSVFGGPESTIYMLLGFGITLLLCWILCCFWYVRRRRTRLKDDIAASAEEREYQNELQPTATDGTAAIPGTTGQQQHQQAIQPQNSASMQAMVQMQQLQQQQMRQQQMGQQIPGQFQTNTMTHFGGEGGGPTGQAGQTTQHQQQLMQQQYMMQMAQQRAQQQLQLQQMQNALRMQQIQQQQMLQQQMTTLQNATNVPQPQVGPNNIVTPPQPMMGFGIHQQQNSAQIVPTFSPSNSNIPNQFNGSSGNIQPIVPGPGGIQGMPTNPAAAAFTNGVAGAFMGGGEAAGAEDSSSNNELFATPSPGGPPPPQFMD